MHTKDKDTDGQNIPPTPNGRESESGHHFNFPFFVFSIYPSRV